MSYTVTNNGDMPSIARYDYGYLSTDGVLDTTDLTMGSYYHLSALNVVWEANC